MQRNQILKHSEMLVILSSCSDLYSDELVDECTNVQEVPS
jgi:hypothetical protein